VSRVVSGLRSPPPPTTRKALRRGRFASFARGRLGLVGGGCVELQVRWDWESRGRTVRVFGRCPGCWISGGLLARVDSWESTNWIPTTRCALRRGRFASFARGRLGLEGGGCVEMQVRWDRTSRVWSARVIRAVWTRRRTSRVLAGLPHPSRPSDAGGAQLDLNQRPPGLRDVAAKQRSRVVDPFAPASPKLQRRRDIPTSNSAESAWRPLF